MTTKYANQITQLAFQTRDKDLLTITELFLSLIKGLDKHLEQVKGACALEEEWFRRIEVMNESEPSRSESDVFLLTLLENRLPYYVISNEFGHEWYPFEMPFSVFEKESEEVHVKLGTIDRFKMSDLLGVSITSN